MSRRKAALAVAKDKRRAAAFSLFTLFGSGEPVRFVYQHQHGDYYMVTGTIWQVQPNFVIAGQLQPGGFGEASSAIFYDDIMLQTVCRIPDKQLGDPKKWKQRLPEAEVAALRREGCLE